MELEYTYFQAEDGFFVGWFDHFPEDIPQGKTLEELEEMLADMYDCLNLAKYHKRPAAQFMSGSAPWSAGRSVQDRPVRPGRSWRYG